MMLMCEWLLGWPSSTITDHRSWPFCSIYGDESSVVVLYIVLVTLTLTLFLVITRAL